MRNKILLVIVCFFFLECSYGQRWFATKSIGYSFYPTVNHSSLRINWYGYRRIPYFEQKTGDYQWDYIDSYGNKVTTFYDFEINLLSIHWMFPNSFKDSKGALGASLISFQYRIGKKRLKPFFNAELVGTSRNIKSLGELENKGVIFNSAAAGLDFYLTNRLILRMSVGAMMRTYTMNDVTWYPFGGLSLSYDYPREPILFQRWIK